MRSKSLSDLTIKPSFMFLMARTCESLYLDNLNAERAFSRSSSNLGVAELAVGKVKLSVDVKNRIATAFLSPESFVMTGELVNEREEGECVISSFRMSDATVANEFNWRKESDFLGGSPCP